MGFLGEFQLFEADFPRKSTGSRTKVEVIILLIQSMKKLYAFLLALVALGVLSSSVVQAQSYTIASYLVRKVDTPDPQGLGSGSNWKSISSGGTAISSGELPYYQGEPYYSSYGVQMPFNVTFADKQLTTANTFSVTCCGSVILSPTWGATWYYETYDYEFKYSYPFYGLNNSANGYSYSSYIFQDVEGDYGSYGYYPNYTLVPFGGQMYNYIPNFSGNQPYFKYAILGSAPNRELVVEAGNQHPYEEAFYNSAGPDYGSWQTVIYEAGISTFQFNYGPTNGNPLLASYNGGYTSGPFTYNGFTFPGSWAYYYYYNYGSYYYFYSEGGPCGMKTTSNQFIDIDWNGNGWNASKPFVYTRNTMISSTYYTTATGSTAQSTTIPYGPNYLFPDTARYLPQSSIKFQIAYPYDFTAGTITLPGNEQPEPLNTAFNPTANITNSGSSIPTSIQVNFAITEFGVGQVYNQTVTIPAASLPAAFATISYAFPSFTPGVAQPGLPTSTYGIFEDTMIIFNLLPTADQNPGDNTSTNEWICSPPNDIKAVQVLNPPPGARSQINVAAPISIRFRNLGTNNQTNVPLTAVVHDGTGSVVFRDTVYIPNWPAGPTGGNSDGSTDFSTSGQGPGKGAYYDTAFPASPTWTPVTLGIDTVFGIAIMSNDQLRGDDTTKAASPILPEYDAASVGVVNPQPGEQKPYLTTWPPAALFQSVGVVDLFDVPIECQIRRCSDGALVFKSDTIEPAINIDQGKIRFYFPTDQNSYHISQIPPGCYNMCAIAKYQGDINSANDTACTQFTIIDRLKGDYYVGVGKQFQSIHQAVDSMRFRGIGANVRLILTDANYTENGNYDVSSQQGAVDMRNISGLGANSTVTWIPYPGVTPTITFTGTQPFCFYMGDLFGGYMKWEGYNPSTVPLPDKITGEPNKRGITIVNNETNAGAVFGIEEGASNITLKDLVMHGNGMSGNDSCSVVRIFNEHNLSIYSSFVHDTVGMNHLVVNNCELGNAKYGIYDHGYHDAFDPIKGVYVSWRNHDNMITRNTIGTVANPLSYAGIQFNNEDRLVVSHNEISNISAANAKGAGNTWNVFGILTPSLTTYVGPPANPAWPGDTGNVTLAWIDANRVRNLTSIGGNAYGIAFQQSAWQYTSTGLTAVKSTLPPVTANRVTNNMVLDLYSNSGQVYPIWMSTSSSTYTTDRDSVFNNSITTTNAAANITIQYQRHAFIWNNIFQNTGAGPYTNYWLEVPRPYASSISSDYNLFDLRGNNVFDSVIEYDQRFGVVFQRLYFRRLNDWRTFVNQDMHSLTGDPLFGTPAMGVDSLHMPPALTYVESPASNNAAWLGTASMARDFDGDVRQPTGPDIGADEWDGFQFSNDLAVQEIVSPAGFSQTSDTALVTTESPLWINAVVKNLSSVGVYNQTVTATVQVSKLGNWVNVGSPLTSAPLTWQVGEAKHVVLQGPSLLPSLANLNDTGVFRVIVTVPNDQNNANNSQQKAFRILLKQNAVLLSYNGATFAGTQNRDSVIQALTRLNVPFDIIDRNAPNGLSNSTIIDYTPWWTIIWSSGDPTVSPVAGQPTQQACLSLQETDEITRYLAAGQSYAKKSLVIAGQNIAYYHGFAFPNNPTGITDSAWLQTTMNTRYVANSPVSGSYSGRIVGQQPAYWTFPDSIAGNSSSETNLSPDVIKPLVITAKVGPVVNGFAYTYSTHPLTPNDSGAGISYYNPLINTVFYGFDWSSVYQTLPAGYGDTTSGTTRTLAAAFAFFRSHAGTILPIDNVNASVQRVNGNAVISWNVTGLTNTVRYDVEQQNQNNWNVLPNPVTAISNQANYAYTQTGIDPSVTNTYRVAAVDQSGAKTYSNTVELGPDASELGFTLAQSYPNPTPGVTEVSFTLPEASQVTIRVMDVTGKVVNADVTNAAFAAGSQSTKLDLSSLPSGSYLYELTATGADGRSVTLSKKLTVEKP